MRGVFLGTPSSAVPTLRALVRSGFDIASVVTQPDRPARRSAKPRPSAVKDAALQLGLDVVQPEKIRTAEFRESLERAAPDLLVVVAYGKILPRGVLAVPRLGSINVHFSLLPRYRGAAPVQWALAHGDAVTGVTTMFINEALDAGDVLLQETVEVEPGEHAPALLDRLAEVGARLLCRTLDELEDGSLVPTPQDPSAATIAPSLKRSDGVADPTLSANEIEGRVRGFDPWPGVWARCRGRRIRIVEARASIGETTGEPPGRVLGLRGQALALACGRGTVLEIDKVQPEGRRPQTALDAVNGRRIVPGDDLEPGD